MRLCAASSPVARACSSRCCICGRPGGRRLSLFRVPSLGVMCDFFFFLCVCAGGHTRPCRAPTGAQSSPVVACNPWVARGGGTCSRHCFSCRFLLVTPSPATDGRCAPSRACRLHPPPLWPLACGSCVRCRPRPVSAAVRLPRATLPRRERQPALVPPPPAAIRRSTPRHRRSSRKGRWGGRPLTPAAFEC